MKGSSPKRVGRPVVDRLFQYSLVAASQRYSAKYSVYAFCMKAKLQQLTYASEFSEDGESEFYKISSARVPSSTLRRNYHLVESHFTQAEQAVANVRSAFGTPDVAKLLEFSRRQLCEPFAALFEKN